MVRNKKAAEPVRASSLDEITDTLARLRSMVDAAGLPDGEKKQDLITHLALASIAAYSFRVSTDDDIIASDE